MPGLTGGNARRVIELVILGDSQGAIKAIGDVAAAADTAAAKAQKLNAIGSAAGTAGRSMLALGLPMVALGGYAAKTAMSFQASMTQIRTQTGATATEVARMSKGIMSLAPQVGEGPQALSSSLYHLESAGIRGAQAMQAMRIASEGAQIGNANLTDTTTSLTATMIAGFRGVNTMQSAMGALNKTVGAGDMTWTDLNDALGTGVLATIKNLGLQVKDFGAAMATLGDNNIRGAQAANRLRMGLMMLVHPSSTATQAMASINLSQLQLASDMRKPKGLLTMLEDLRSHLTQSGMGPNQQMSVLSEIFGGGKTSAGIITLYNQLDRLKSKYTDVTKGANTFGAAWAKFSQTAQATANRTKATLETALIGLGNSVLPLVTSLLPPLVSFISFLGTAFDALPGPVKDAVGIFSVFLIVGGATGLMIEKGIKAYQAWAKVITFVKDSQVAQTLASKLGLTSSIAPTTELAAANERLAASYDAVTASARAAAVSEETAGVTAGTAAGETAGGGFLGGLGALGVGGTAALAAPILGPLALALWGPGDPHNRIGKHAARVLAARNRVRGPVGQTGRFEHGGLLPRHLDMGGDVFGPSVGTDSIPIMGSPGEFMLNQPAAQQIGPGALNYMNTTGRMPTPNITVEPPKVELWVDGRKLAEAVARAVLRKAARGPSSLVGGSLATNVQGPPYTQP